MTNHKNDKFKKILGKNPSKTTIVAHPDAIKKMIEDGVIWQKFITYDEFIEDIFTDRKKNAHKLLTGLPQINPSIADAVVTSIYEEIRSSLAFGVFTSTIFNSILLLEYSMRSRCYKELLKSDPNTKWEDMEELNMEKLIPRLRKFGAFSKKESAIVDDFRKNMINPYLHFNIKKLIKGIVLGKAPKLNLTTNEITEEVDIDASKHRFMWFSAKQFYDKERVKYVVSFCIWGTNKLLS